MTRKGKEVAIHFHPAEREQLLSQVFEGRAEVIDGVVDEEEAVVVAVALPNRNGRILSEETDLLLGFADPLLQPFNPLVNGVSAKEILFEDRGRPSTEFCGVF